MSISEKMTALADAVRGATGKTEQMSIDAMIAALGSVYPQLWGGKMISGSFTLAQDTTGEYTIINSSDEAIKGLLYDGETFSGVVGKIALLVMRQATDTFTASNYPNTLGSALRVVTKNSSYHSVRQYWNASGSSNTQGGGTVIDSNKIAVTFDSSCVGSASFTYNWVAWRHVK